MGTISQLIGLGGFALKVYSFQGKDKNAIIRCQLLAVGLFALHFWLMGAYSGFLLNCINVFRSVFFLKNNRKRKGDFLRIFVLVCMYVLLFIWVCSRYNGAVEVYNIIIELLPIIGMCLITISYAIRNPLGIRLIALISSPLCLVYNYSKGSVGTVLAEVFSIISSLIGIVRYNVKLFGRKSYGTQKEYKCRK